MRGRDTTDTPRPISQQATGLWFRVPGKRGKYQRYDEAPPFDGSAHWYLIDGSWHAFRESDVRPANK